MIKLSLDSGTDAQCAMLRNEVDALSGAYDLDPLAILIAEEDQEFDVDTAIRVINLRHRGA